MNYTSCITHSPARGRANLRAAFEAARQDIHAQLAQRGDVGTVSHGTLRPADLIPAFLEELRKRDSDAYTQVAILGRAVPCYVEDEGDSSEWWASDDAHWLLEELFDALDAAAPEGTYFGAHPGDGSDYGFWPMDIDD